MTEYLNPGPVAGWSFLALAIQIMVWIVTRKQFSLFEGVGIVLAAIVMFLWRIVRAIRSARQVKQMLAQSVVPEKPLATSALDYLRMYKLENYEVVLTQDRNRRPIKVDFARHHTLVAGTTQFGKTNLINLILIQLFGKGEAFLEHTDVYLIDLKGDEEDHLHMWAPLCAGYYSITEDEAGIEKAISILHRLADSAHKGKKERHILVFIDEIAALTTHAIDAATKRAGESALMRITQKLGSRGTLIGSTQYPHFQTVSRPITANMDRKIAFHVDGPGHFDMIFRRRPKPNEKLPEEPGEFLLADPGKRGLAFGKALLVNLPSEIDQVVYNALVIKGEQDVRLALLLSLINGKNPGDKVKAINTQYRLMKGTPREMTQDQVNYHYRNYAYAGIFEEPTKKGTFLRLAGDEAIIALEKYITAGKWKSEPEAFVSTNN